MKLICSDCHKTFLYAAKKIYPITVLKYSNESTASPLLPTTFETYTLETHVCPYCQSLNIQEVMEEPRRNPKITALIESPNAEVNARLLEGYEVLEDKIYAKSTILVKHEKSKEA